MQSRISVEVDFQNNNLPIIQILRKDSNDVRDKLVSAFLQSLQHTSRWCKITYVGGLDSNQIEVGDQWKISPITPQELPEEMRLMQVAFPHKPYEVEIQDNSDGFRAFLDHEKIEYRSNGHFTTIINPVVDLFDLGRKFQLYKDDIVCKVQKL